MPPNRTAHPGYLQRGRSRAERLRRPASDRRHVRSRQPTPRSRARERACQTVQQPLCLDNSSTPRRGDPRSVPDRDSGVAFATHSPTARRIAPPRATHSPTGVSVSWLFVRTSSSDLRSANSYQDGSAFGEDAPRRDGAYGDRTRRLNRMGGGQLVVSRGVSGIPVIVGNCARSGYEATRTEPKRRSQ